MKRYALGTAGVIFALIALLQLTRLYFQFPLMVGVTYIPLWVNVIALFLTAALSFWMFYTLKMDD